MRSLISVCVVLVCSARPAEAATTSFSVEEPTGVERQGWPVTSGVPLAEGALQDGENAALFDAEGQEVPLQTEVLARWPDGSVRWLLLDFQVDLAAEQRRAFSLRYGPDVRRASVGKPVRVRKHDNAVVVDTGPMRLELPCRGSGVLGSVWLDLDRDGKFALEERVAGPRASEILLTDKEGRPYHGTSAATPAAEFVVEQSGPMRACVRISGHHVSEQGHMFRYVVRVHAFRGQPFVRCDYTFINDYQEALMAQVRNLGLRFPAPLGPDGRPRASSRILGGKRMQRAERSSIDRLFQVDESHYQLNGEATGRRAPGWAALGDDAMGMAVGLREFWQNWPKSISVSSDGIRVGVCPTFSGALYDGKPLEEENKLYYALRGGLHTFKVGVARTHELWARSDSGRAWRLRLSGGALRWRLDPSGRLS